MILSHVGTIVDARLEGGGDSNRSAYSDDREREVAERSQASKVA